MGIYTKMLTNSFKTKLSFRVDYIISTLFSFGTLVLQISIWQALFSARGGTSLAGINLTDMIAYNIIVLFTRSIVKNNIMNEINDMVVKGEVAIRLLLPLGFRRHMFYSSITSNIFWAVYSTIPPIIIAILMYGFRFDFQFINLTLFVLSIALAFVISYCFSFILGISVFWFKNSFFLSWMVGAWYSLFSGSFVPMWFFPAWLNSLSFFLPFRYIIFEPVAILLGKYSYSDAIGVILLQLIWVGVLWLVGSLMWKNAQRIVFSQGG